MKVIFDVGHPAQVHNFKHIYWSLEKKGHIVLFVAKDKEVTKNLLENYNLKHIILSKNAKGLVRKIFRLFRDCYKFYKTVSDFKPDIVLSRMSIHSCFITKLLKINHIAFSDTEKSINFSYFPDAILTSKSFLKSFCTKQIRFSGSIELFYLHPNRFKPDPSVLDLLGVKQGDKYVIIRFIAWTAHHDVGEKGLDLEIKRKIVKEISKYAKVFISAEGSLPTDLEKYKINIPFERMHDALYYAELYLGEGGTMASESAVLGSPAIYVNSLTMGYIEEEEKAGLLFRITNSEQVLDKALEIITDDKKDKFKIKKDEFLKDKIDITAFTVWFIENYPESVKIMKENPDYQYSFK